MILKVKNSSYNDSYWRAHFARMLARIIDASTDGSPYKPNENDDTFWRVDPTGNNWTLVFNKEDNFKTLRIEYRYRNSHPEYERALFNWLRVKMHNLELIEE